MQASPLLITHLNLSQVALTTLSCAKTSGFFGIRTPFVSDRLLWDTASDKTMMSLAGFHSNCKWFTFLNNCISVISWRQLWKKKKVLLIIKLCEINHLVSVKSGEVISMPRSSICPNTICIFQRCIRNAFFSVHLHLLIAFPQELLLLKTGAALGADKCTQRWSNLMSSY